MMSTLRLGSMLLLVVALAGCRDRDPETVELSPPETFTWTGGQPVSFSPPPEDWKRSRYQNGGAEGVDFVKAGSKGEMIFAAERFFLGRRDFCARIEEVLHDLDDYDRRTFAGAMNKTRLYVDESFDADSERAVAVVNYTLDRAQRAYMDDHIAIAREELSRALEQAARIRYTVEDTVERVIFTAEGNSVYPVLRVEEPTAGTLAGEPTIAVRFSFEGHGVPMIGRRIYVVKNNRMFEIGYQGLEENLPLFERFVDSIRFPPGSCEH